MPKRYESIRDALIKKGMSPREAKTHAARIYNASRKKGEPVVSNKKD